MSTVNAEIDGDGSHPGYLVKYPDGYTSWSPKKQFEEAYRPIDGLTFGLAIEAMRMGKRVARAGWNGRGMYLSICEGGGFRDGFRTVDFIYMKTADDQITPWVTSQMDVLAGNWMIVE